MSGTLPPLTHPTYEMDNGVIRLRMNDHAPIITSMWVMGALAVPHDNVGADFQMATRSTKGDAYNPTQGGDCRGMPSLLTGVTEHWNAVDKNTHARYGILFEIEPRNYNEPSYPGCLGVGEILPYIMLFGVTLGDGTSMPRELMVLEMSIRKKPGSAAEDIVKGLSELPVIYLDNTLFRYAYYSVDSHPADGLTFQRMLVTTTTSGNTHDTQLWPTLTNYHVAQPARAIMLCSRGDAVEQPQLSMCMAIYSHEGARMQASHRMGALYRLTSITAVIDDPVDPLITDYVFHTQRRLVAVGDADTVSASFAWAAIHLKPEDWKKW